MTTSAEDIRDLVLTEAETEPSPHVVAARIVDKLAGDADALRIALSLAAPGWVASLIRRPHMVRSGAPVAYVDGEGHRRASAKTAGLVDWYLTRLRASVNVGTGQWKRLADCTPDDLRYMATVRYQQAKANEAAAERYRKLGLACQEKGVAIVAELPAEIGKAILSA
jgi:hypothetical protein